MGENLCVATMGQVPMHTSLIRNKTVKLMYCNSFIQGNKVFPPKPDRKLRHSETLACKLLWFCNVRAFGLP